MQKVSISDEEFSVRANSALWPVEIYLHAKGKGKSMPKVFGIFEDSSRAQQAVERLTKNHIARDKIQLFDRTSDDGTARKQAGGTGTGAAIVEATSPLLSGFTDMGVPQTDATNYEQQVRTGKVLVTVRTENDAEADQVSNLLDVEGAVEVEGAGERGNAEAAPGYEGARADEETHEPGGTSQSNRPRRNRRADRGRIRIYR
jgi:hypothetical protein